VHVAGLIRQAGLRAPQAPACDEQQHGFAPPEDPGDPG
jgi:aminoglycoside/choline kinase family phosphotransferase